MNELNDQDIDPKYDIGVIHGRFQVFHNDHLKYLLAGKQLCRHLVVGITNPDPFMVKKEAVDPKRSDPLANPLTYFERYLLVQSSLKQSGLHFDQFSIVPLPINMPERYQYYVPLDAVFFVSIYDDWGRKKLSYFESLGLKTHILREVAPEQKGISAGQIRNAMISDQPWEHLVPESVALLVKQWEISARLKKLKDELVVTS